MSSNLNAPNLSTLAGRVVAVRVPRAPGACESFVPGVLEVSDVAGDQDGPAVVVVLERKAADERSLPHAIALDAETVKRLLLEPPDSALTVSIY